MKKIIANYNTNTAIAVMKDNSKVEISWKEMQDIMYDWKYRRNKKIAARFNGAIRTFTFKEA